MSDEQTTSLPTPPQIPGIIGLGSVWYQIDQDGQDALSKNLQTEYQKYCENMAQGKDASNDIVVRENQLYHNVVNICPHGHAGSQDRVICVSDPRPGKGQGLIVYDYSLKHNASYDNRLQAAQRAFSVFQRDPDALAEHLANLEREEQEEAKVQAEILSKKTLKQNQKDQAKLSVKELYDHIEEWQGLAQTPAERADTLVWATQAITNHLKEDNIDIEDLRRMRRLLKKGSVAKEMFPNDEVRSILEGVLKETDIQMSNQGPANQDSNEQGAIEQDPTNSGAANPKPANQGLSNRTLLAQAADWTPISSSGTTEKKLGNLSVSDMAQISGKFSKTA